MAKTTIDLDDEQLRALERLAAIERQTVPMLVRRAVDAYLARELDDTAWAERFEQLVARVQSRIPASTSPEEIEADITAAREEVRRERRAARGD